MYAPRRSISFCLSISLLISLVHLAGCQGGASGSPDAGIDRGPTVLEVDGDPNGLWWDDTEQVLFVADDNGNRVLAWTDEAGFDDTIHILPVD